MREISQMSKEMYKNIEIELLLKFPSGQKRKKIKTIIINITDNNILKDRLYIHTLLSFLLSVPINYSPKLIFAQSAISCFGRKKADLIGIHFILSLREFKNFHSYFLHFILPVLQFNSRSATSINYNLAGVLNSKFPLSFNYTTNLDDLNDPLLNNYFFSRIGFPIPK